MMVSQTLVQVITVDILYTIPLKPSEKPSPFHTRDRYGLELKYFFGSIIELFLFTLYSSINNKVQVFNRKSV